MRSRATAHRANVRETVIPSKISVENERGDTRMNNGKCDDVEGQGPKMQVTEKAKRRRFSADYNLRIVREARVCSDAGAIGTLLRHEAYGPRSRSMRKVIDPEVSRPRMRCG